ncbi:uncharacterized protein LOC126906876 [Daktulosphaira vitifoliae]|uniref:uncharacterized protein LOC126906876 n=1 Tax=Daktulosphaira vitifoliae TaxID=58002 RepID=UPI0021A9B039|nr:uncharacterized protein LOC126906876 [Daktulosphaira vitifoliae]
MKVLTTMVILVVFHYSESSKTIIDAKLAFKTCMYSPKAPEMNQIDIELNQKLDNFICVLIKTEDKENSKNEIKKDITNFVCSSEKTIPKDKNFSVANCQTLVDQCIIWFWNKILNETIYSIFRDSIMKDGVIKNNKDKIILRCD